MKRHFLRRLSIGCGALLLLALFPSRSDAFVFGLFKRHCCTPPVVAAPTYQYVPQTTYRTQVVNVPVTVFRPVASCDPCTGCAVTLMQPMTTFTQQTRVVPVTTFRVVPINTCPTTCARPLTARWVAPTTTFFAPATADVAAPSLWNGGAVTTIPSTVQLALPATGTVDPSASVVIPSTGASTTIAEPSTTTTYTEPAPTTTSEPAPATTYVNPPSSTTTTIAPAEAHTPTETPQSGLAPLGVTGEPTPAPQLSAPVEAPTTSQPSTAPRTYADPQAPEPNGGPLTPIPESPAEKSDAAPTNDSTGDPSSGPVFADPPDTRTTRLPSSRFTTFRPAAGTKRLTSSSAHGRGTTPQSVDNGGWRPARAK